MWRKRFPEVWDEARESILADARAALGHLVPKAIRTQDTLMDMVAEQPGAAGRAAIDVLDRVLHKAVVASEHGPRRTLIIRVYDRDGDEGGSVRGTEVVVDEDDTS